MGRRLVESVLLVLRWVGLTALVAAAPASADTRVALVIGNAAYRTLPPLTGRLGDAALIAARLKALGFGVTSLKDASKLAMRQGIADFVARVRAAPIGTVVVVYYTGHGLSDGRGLPWMVPTDASLSSLTAPTGIPQELVSLGTLMDGLRGAASARTVIVFDACTDSPFDASGSAHGIPSAEGMLVALPSAAGTCPIDGNDGVAPYAKALASELDVAGRSIDEVFRQVQDRVFATSKGKQRPAVSNRLLANLVLREELPSVSAGSPSDAAPAARVALGRRLAFTAGIDAYPNLSRESQLERAVADADAVARTLEAIGFTVTRLGNDASRPSFLRRFAEFAAGIRKGDTALVFFAGHGIGIDGTNYLLPADVPRLGEGDEFLVKGASMAETDLIAALHERGARVTVMVIDACRNNPFPRAGTRSLGTARGLSIKEPPAGVFSLYSAGFGQRALDQLSRREDTDPNSVFTRVFIKDLRKPGLNLIDLGESVRDEVADLAESDGHPQVPAVYNQIRNARGVFLGEAAR